MSEKSVKRLKLKGSPTTLTVGGSNFQQTLHTQIVDLKLTPVHSGDSRAALSIKPYVRKDLNIGTDTIDVAKLKQQYPNLEPVTLSKYSYADVEMILGQDKFYLIRSLKYFESYHQYTPVAVHVP